MYIRSPNNWLMSLTFAVSPQPAHAPLNSNSGVTNWLPLMLASLNLLGSGFGIDRK